jgi:hypothetical protein
VSAEFLTALASIVTAIVIAATAAAALIQLRHMRSANTLNAMLTLRSTFNEEAFRDATERLRGGAVERALEDPGFQKLLLRQAADPAPDVAHLYRSVMLVLNWYEVFGSLVLQGVISMRDIGDNYASVVDLHWKQTSPATTYIRRNLGDDAFYEMFEYLTVLSRRWLAEHPSVYPAGVPRIAAGEDLSP